MIVSLMLVTNYYLESENIEEYCEWYFALGIDKIYIVDDIYKQEHHLIEIPYLKKRVKEGRILIEEDSSHNQHKIIQEFYVKHNREFDWCCLFDSDEYLQLNYHNNIKDFLNDKRLKFNKDCDSIAISWLNFDDNGHLFKPNNGKSIIDNFMVNPMWNFTDEVEVKVIVKGGLENMSTYIGHSAIANYRTDRIKYCNGKNISNRFTQVPDYSIASLNHLKYPSYEGFMNRRKIGRIDLNNYNDKDLNTQINNFLEVSSNYFKDNGVSTDKLYLFISLFNKFINEFKNEQKENEDITNTNN